MCVFICSAPWSWSLDNKQYADDYKQISGNAFYANNINECFAPLCKLNQLNIFIFN